MKRCAVISLVLSALALHAATVKAADDYTWLGGSGSWSDSTQWNPSHTPNSATNDNAVISAGAIDVNGSFSINNLSFAAGKLLGSGTLDVYGVGTLSSANTKLLAGFTLNNHGQFNWTGGILRPIDSTFTFNNLADGTFDIQTDSAVLSQTGGSFATMIFNNAGWLRKTAGSGSSQWIDATIASSGTIDVRSGTLTIYRGSTSGVVNVESSSGLVLGNFDFEAGSNFSGLGKVTVGAGAAPSGTARFNADISVFDLTLNGTAIDGGGRLSVTEFDWSRGHLLGSGTLNVFSGDVNLPTTDTWQLFRNIDNRATLAFNTAANIETGNGAVINNASAIDFFADTTLNRPQAGNGPAMTIQNNAYLSKAGGTGVTLIEAVVNNTGTISVFGGTLTLGWGGVSESGSTLKVAAGATLRFQGPGYWLKSGTSISGAGRIENAGSLRAPAALLTGHALEMNGVELAIDGDLDTNQFNWNAGVLSGAGTTKLKTPTIFSTDWGVLAGRTLDTDGNSLTWSGGAVNAIGTSAFGLSGAGTINSSGFFGVIVTGDTPLNFGNINNPGGLVLNNSGYFSVDGPSELHFLGPMNSSGAFVVDHGTVSFDGGGAATAGSLAFGNATLVFPTSFTFGGVDIYGPLGTVIFSNPGTLDISPAAGLESHVLVEEGTVNFATAFMDVPLLKLTGGVANINASAVATTIHNDAGLRIASGSTLSGMSYTQTGSLTLDGGTLSISTPVGLAGGLLAGHGTIAGDVLAGAVVIAPGEGDGQIGLIRMIGDVSIGDLSFSIMDIDATTLTNDLIDIDGSVNLGNSLLFITMAGSPSLIPPDQSFTILTADGGTSGTVLFTDLFSPGRIDVYDALNPQDPIGSFRLSDTGQALILDQFEVPEPTMLPLLALAGLVRRRHRRLPHWQVPGSDCRNGIRRPPGARPPIQCKSL